MPTEPMTTSELEAHMAAIAEAAELAYGLLWMIETEPGSRTNRARKALGAAIGETGRARGINAAMAAGFHADHPPGATYYAGMK